MNFPLRYLVFRYTAKIPFNCNPSFSNKPAACEEMITHTAEKTTLAEFIHRISPRLRSERNRMYSS